MIEYVDMRMKSDPGRTFPIPKGYEQRAIDFLSRASDNAINVLNGGEEFPWVRNPGITDILLKLALAKYPDKKAVLQDRLALKMAVYFNENEIRKEQAASKEKPKMTDRPYQVDSQLVALDQELAAA